MTIWDRYRMNGKVALITGGSRGLGKEMGKALAEAGASVVLCSRGREQVEAAARQLSEATGQRCRGYPCDVAEPDQVDALVAWTLEEYGRIDVLINNAALYYDQDIMDQSIDYMRKVIEINLIGQLICARAVYPTMKEQGSGSIINISSTAAYPLPLPPMPFDNFSTNAYGLTKSGMIYLTKMMARQAGQDGIRVNAIAPGVTLSEATRKIVPEWAIEGLETGAPLGTALQPDDLTGTAVYLASEDSRLMTGQTLVVDAGVWMNG